jgi:hypothetical protein
MTKCLVAGTGSDRTTCTCRLVKIWCFTFWPGPLTIKSSLRRSRVHKQVLLRPQPHTGPGIPERSGASLKPRHGAPWGSLSVVQSPSNGQQRKGWVRKQSMPASLHPHAHARQSSTAGKRTSTGGSSRAEHRRRRCGRRAARLRLRLRPHLPQLAPPQLALRPIRCWRPPTSGSLYHSAGRRREPIRRLALLLRHPQELLSLLKEPIRRTRCPIWCTSIPGDGGWASKGFIQRGVGVYISGRLTS